MGGERGDCGSKSLTKQKKSPGGRKWCCGFLSIPFTSGWVRTVPAPVISRGVLLVVEYVFKVCEGWSKLALLFHRTDRGVG